MKGADWKRAMLTRFAITVLPLSSSPMKKIVDVLLDEVESKDIVNITQINFELAKLSEKTHGKDLRTLHQDFVLSGGNPAHSLQAIGNKFHAGMADRNSPSDQTHSLLSADSIFDDSSVSLGKPFQVQSKKWFQERLKNLGSHAIRVELEIDTPTRIQTVEVLDKLRRSPRLRELTLRFSEFTSADTMAALFEGVGGMQNVQSFEIDGFVLRRGQPFSSNSGNRAALAALVDRNPRVAAYLYRLMDAMRISYIRTDDQSGLVHAHVGTLTEAQVPLFVEKLRARPSFKALAMRFVEPVDLDTLEDVLKGVIQMRLKDVTVNGVKIVTGGQIDRTRLQELFGDLSDI